MPNYYQRYLHDFQIAVEAILTNKLKSILTALGIIFGVAAVISMLAIGNGAQQEILEQIKLVGVNNIIINPLLKIEGVEDEAPSGKKKKKFSAGLSLNDVRAIEQIIPQVENLSALITQDTYALRAGRRKSVKLYGVENSYFHLFNLNLHSGSYFSENQEYNGRPVCVIGSELKLRLFAANSPIGKTIKCGKVWLTVVGVLQARHTDVGNADNLGLSSPANGVYVPVKTMILRYRNRALITEKMLKNNNNDDENKPKETPNYHQLDQIIVQVENSEQLNASTEVLKRLLLRRHSQLLDFEIVVPELLLKQQQKTKDIFNLVLGAIAGISLIVGGIGIMNIMLASTLERTKEIGTRMALGATKNDIVVQFLSESTLISLTGGVLGIFLGFLISFLISLFSDIQSIVSPATVFIAFGVSVSVGVFFGYMPAKRASENDPAVSLRN